MWRIQRSPPVVGKIDPAQFDEMDIVDAVTYDQYLYLLTRHWDRSRDEFESLTFSISSSRPSQ